MCRVTVKPCWEARVAAAADWGGCDSPAFADPCENPRFYGAAGIIRRMTITIKDGADIEGMRVAGRLAAEVLDMLTPHVKPGITTDELDRSRTSTSSTSRARSRRR